MNKIVHLITPLILGVLVIYFLFFSLNELKSDNSKAQNTSKIEKSIILVFKKSMKHWDLEYDTLPENRSGAACIPWLEITDNFISKEIFEALGYGFNLYDENIAVKAAMEGCNRMRVYYKLQNRCDCEMILFNDESRIQVPHNVK